jgi:hypothetical protein
VIIPACSKDQKDDTTFTADLKFPNGIHYSSSSSSLYQYFILL